jgi:hypothetical protein
MDNKPLNYISLIISIIGTLNWGLIGLFKFNLVSFLFGDMTLLARIVYVIVGICGLYLFTFFAPSQPSAK